MLPKLILYLILGGATLGLQLGFGYPVESLMFLPSWSSESLSLDLIYGLGIGIGLVALSRMSVQHFSWGKQLDIEFRTVLGPLSRRDIFLLALLSSLTEELFFRGFLQPILGLHYAAIILGLAHFPYRAFLVPWTLTALGVGYLFGWVFDARHCLVAPIVAHFVVNYFNLHYILRPRADEQLSGPPQARRSQFGQPHGAGWAQDDDQT